MRSLIHFSKSSDTIASFYEQKNKQKLRFEPLSQFALYSDPYDQTSGDGGITAALLTLVSQCSGPTRIKYINNNWYH